jgi:hypothetical protein
VPQENSLYVSEFCPNVFFQVKHPLPCLGKMGQECGLILDKQGHGLFEAVVIGFPCFHDLSYVRIVSLMFPPPRKYFWWIHFLALSCGCDLRAIAQLDPEFEIQLMREIRAKSAFAWHWAPATEMSCG